MYRFSYFTRMAMECMDLSSVLCYFQHTCCPLVILLENMGLVYAFMTSRLDFCNALLGGCPASLINKLNVVKNAAARIINKIRIYYPHFAVTTLATH